MTPQINTIKNTIIKFIRHDHPCVTMCILSALNSVEKYYYHIDFRMDCVHIGTQTTCVLLYCKVTILTFPFFHL